MSKIDYVTGSDNIFEDLGLPNAAERLIKASLAIQIARIIKARRLSQQSAADLMGVSQAKVSAMLKGQLRGVSEAKLHQCLNGLGHDVVIVVSPSANPTRGTTTVQAMKPAPKKRSEKPTAARKATRREPAYA